MRSIFVMDETMNISKSREIGASVDSVWELLTDSAREQKYWTNIRNVKVLSERGNTIEREATVGPPGYAHRSHQKITLDEKKSISLLLKGEAMTGERTITLSEEGPKTKVKVEWNLKMDGVPNFVNSIVKNQISSITSKALSRIAADAEGRA